MTVGGQVLVTSEEKQRLESELKQLINVKRPELADKIGRAAADGDLSENGAYKDAKERQGHIEGRIQELEYLVRNAVVVEPRQDRVGMGNTVVIEDEGGKRRMYRMVSRHSARPSEGLISLESPLGAALVDHQAGETVSYRTPDGKERSVTILTVE